MVGSRGRSRGRGRRRGVRGEEPVLREHGPERGDVDGLGDEVVEARLVGVLDVLGVGVGAGADDEASARGRARPVGRLPLAEFFRAGDAVHDGHEEVHDGDVVALLAEERQPLLAVARLVDGELAALEDALEHLADRRRVLDDERLVPRLRRRGRRDVGRVDGPRRRQGRRRERALRRRAAPRPERARAGARGRQPVVEEGRRDGRGGGVVLQVVRDLL
mmetsp:Transcript_22688/g.78071  ORF Transcript_22688/g.78071 Transcript_22688/m.78071 type:complete len:219 (+) Transcript_22688:52-708(+)